MRGNHIGLALQGGGSYAAFTSGVLRTMLKPERGFLRAERIQSISGTSGGALNALLLGSALHQGLADPCRYVDRLWKLNRLERLLKDQFSSLQLLPDAAIATMVGMNREWMNQHPGFARAVSDSPGMKANAMALIDAMIHQAASHLPDDDMTPLYPGKPPFITVAATEMRQAVAHYFTNNRAMIERYGHFEISRQRNVLRPLCLRGVYASIAHPLVFEPVAIGEDRYWDGYYTSNPPFVYLFREGCDEVVLVRLIQQERDEIGEGKAAISDRIEEIIQNTTVNMEILAYLAMREMAISNRGSEGGSRLKLGERFNPAAIYHEIRLLKPGNIADEGYPLSDFIDKLIRLGRKVVAGKDGFIKAYAGAPPGIQVISEVDFESEKVRSRTVDLDALLFTERDEGRVEEAEDGGFMRFFRQMF